MNILQNWLIGATFGLLIVVFALVLTIVQRVTKLSHVNAKLDALLGHAGIDFDPFDYVTEDVLDAIKNGDKIGAIRCYRKANGASLRDAKQFVEEIQRRGDRGEPN